MSDFTTSWRAECPRCSEQWSEQKIVCNNCGKGGIGVHPITNHGVRSLFFGCWHCNIAYPFLKCLKCGSEMRGVAKVKGWFGYYS